MKTGKYARDTWAGIRKKLTGTAPKGAEAVNGDNEDDGNEEEGAVTQKSKPKPKSTPRKRKTGMYRSSSYSSPNVDEKCRCR